MNHLILLGDSVFDNARYVGRGLNVLTQLSARLPVNWKSSLRAVDGSVISSIRAQLQRLPSDATHLVVSVGGNDALRHAGVLDQRARSVAEALELLAAIRAEFEWNYQTMLDDVLGPGLPTAVCTIYDARFPEPRRRRLAATALTVLNDSITRQVFARGLPLIDLRLIFDSDDYYANPIEPSARGGERLASVIVGLFAEPNSIRRRSEVFV
jgi:hypothetical protein